jgi:hypothetical protein
MADAGFDLAFSIRIAHAARQSDRAVTASLACESEVVSWGH